MGKMESLFDIEKIKQVIMGTTIYFPMITEIGNASMKSHAVLVYDELSRLPKWVLLGSMSSVVAYFYVNRKWSYWSRRGVVGPPPEVSGFGHTIKMFNCVNEPVFEKWEAEYGKQFGLYLGLNPVLFVADIELVRQINIKQFSKFQIRKQKSGMDTLLGQMSADFMTIIEGEKWRRIRNSATPLMSQSNLSELLRVIVAAGKVTCEAAGVGKQFELKELSADYASKAIMACLTGIDPRDAAQIDEAAHHARKIMPDNLSVFQFMLLGLIPESIRFKLNMSVIPSSTQTYLQRIFDALFDDYAANPNRRTFSSQMMSASTLQFVLHRLVSHPPVQELLHESVKNP